MLFLVLTSNIFHWKEQIFMKYITCYIKNHWTKYRLVCTNFDALSMLIPDMYTNCDISKIFEKNYEKFDVARPHEKG